MTAGNTEAELKRRCNYCEERRSKHTLGYYRYCDTCAAIIIKQTAASQLRMRQSGHFID